MRLYCYNCGKSVSAEVPDSTIVRASLQCPECLEAASKAYAEWEAKQEFSPFSPEAMWADRAWQAAIEKMCERKPS